VPQPTTLPRAPNIGKRVIEGNIKMDLREIGYGGMDCNDLAQESDQWKALVKTVMNLRVP
jgi:hypothetical protein